MTVSSVGELNIVLGWAWMVLGILSGALIGMWAFDGPLPCPPRHEDYASLPRRLVRLAHIAFFALPAICILYGMHIDHTGLMLPLKKLGSISMIICMVGVPVLLVAASFKIQFKYLEVIPVSAGILALILMAWGKIYLLNF